MAVASHVVVKVGPVPVMAAPRLLPSTLNCTDEIPTVEVAFAEIVTTPVTGPATGVVMLTAGGLTVFVVVTETGADVVGWLRVSAATAVIVCGPLTAVLVS